MNRRETKVGLLACFAFAMAFPASISGALLIAPLIAFCAILITPVYPLSWRSIEWASPVIPGMLFLLWACLSFLWSPHPDAEQIPKTLLGVPLYALFAWRVGALEGPWRARAEACLIFFVLAAGCFFLFETLTNAQGTVSFKIGFEGADTNDMRDIIYKAYRSLGHGVVPLVLMAGPVAALLWMRGHKGLAILIMALTASAALSYGFAINAVAMFLAGIAVALASLRPRLALPVMFTLLAGFIVVMPVFLPSMYALLPEEFIARLPDSWAWRLEIWAFASERITENPWVGYGLDASRQIGEGILLAGIEWDALPLHPHNAALHVWLETGLVGVILLAATLLATGEMLARLETISRVQILALVWVVIAYACLLVFSYGVWQEWHQASLAMAIAVVRFIKPETPARQPAAQIASEKVA